MRSGCEDLLPKDSSVPNVVNNAKPGVSRNKNKIPAFGFEGGIYQNTVKVPAFQRGALLDVLWHYRNTRNTGRAAPMAGSLCSVQHVSEGKRQRDLRRDSVAQAKNNQEGSERWLQWMACQSAGEGEGESKVRE